MSFGAKEARIHENRKPRVNLCSCGEEIDATELLCRVCYFSIHGVNHESMDEDDARYSLLEPRK